MEFYEIRKKKTRKLLKTTKNGSYKILLHTTSEYNTFNTIEQYEQTRFSVPYLIMNISK